MTKKYTFRFADKAVEKLLIMAGWTKESGVSPQKALSDWLHRLVSEPPPGHGGKREGAFVGKKAAKKKKAAKDNA